MPAEALALHVHDGVFTRMGASDNLLMGRSTFMEELGDASQVGAAAGWWVLVVGCWDGGMLRGGRRRLWQRMGHQ